MLIIILRIVLSSKGLLIYRQLVIDGKLQMTITVYVNAEDKTVAW
ncbi:hypothetical protein CRENPOLYSF1_350020 [Crenothrix polyspora]|uniref:Uncharacterized protein n=1 Tax=Crenothrix polyspora TaxID=360316 RepID=A0A1R4H9H5_9GAMM|nr:hypothetical protein CRENPOLYSF1_350020 [Crenothrix polyspora]